MSNITERSYKMPYMKSNNFKFQIFQFAYIQILVNPTGSGFTRKISTPTRKKSQAKLVFEQTCAVSTSVFSTAIFAMEGINVVMPVENEMANPGDFLGCPGVLNITMALVATLYGIVGLFGYLKYGNEVLGSITLNLPQGEPLALTAKILVAIAVFFTYFLQMYAPMDIMWTRLKDRFSARFHNEGQILMRTLSVTVTVILAAAVPDLELLIGLVGAIFFSTLGLFIPLVVQTVYKWDRGLGMYSYILWKNMLLLVFYILILVSGCYTSITAIVTRLRSA